MTATQKKQYSAQERKEMALNLHLAKECQLTKCGMPIVDSVKDLSLPVHWTGFNNSKTAEHPERKGVHFYIDDYQFERLWKSPALYLQRLRKFRCIISPDFSLYVDMPEPMKVWNVFRNRLLASWLQKEGLTVIPNVSWSNPDSYTYCFDGLPQRSTIAIGSMGANRHGLTRYLWLKGYHTVVNKLRPSLILRYGDKVPGEDEGQSIYIENNTIQRLHHGR